MVCGDNSLESYAHSGRLRSSGKTIRFQVDHSSVHTTDGNVLSTEYSLDDERLTLTFDSAQNEGAVRLRGQSIWQRIARIGPVNPTAPPASGCKSSDGPTLNRSNITEARVDK
jgi:hypothetical protein